MKFWCTYGINPTRYKAACKSARSLIALLINVTIIVSNTLRLGINCEKIKSCISIFKKKNGILTTFTSTPIASKGSLRTYTCNTSERCKSICNNTLLCTGTRVASNARIPTRFSHASHLRRTIFVYPAFWFLRYNSCNKMGKHAFQSQILIGAYQCTYVLRMLHSHLLVVETCIYRILCGP